MTTTVSLSHARNNLGNSHYPKSSGSSLSITEMLLIKKLSRPFSVTGYNIPNQTPCFQSLDFTLLKAPRGHWGAEILLESNVVHFMGLWFATVMPRASRELWIRARNANSVIHFLNFRFFNQCCRSHWISCCRQLVSILTGLSSVFQLYFTIQMHDCTYFCNCSKAAYPRYTFSL